MMTSRERVRKVLSHEIPDRVPIAIGGNLTSGICVDAYADLVRHLGLKLPEPPKVYDLFQMLARVDEPVRRALHIDVIELENPKQRWGFWNNAWKPWKTFPGNTVSVPVGFNPVIDAKGYVCIHDDSGRSIAHMPPGGYYFERTEPTAMSEQIVKMDPRKWESSLALYTDEELRAIEAEGRRLHEETDYAVCGGCGRIALSDFGLFAGHTFSDWMVILMTEPAYAAEIMAASARRAYRNVELFLEAAGKYLDFIYVSGFDFGTQDREMFDPEIFRQLYLPHYRKICAMIHARYGLKTAIHSCGSNRGFLDLFIEAGLDVFNPVQTSAARMDPAELKKEFGDRLVFWGGGVDTQKVLPFGTPAEVRAQVRQRIETFGKGGGFLFCPIHNIQYKVPPANIMAMIEAVLEFGTY
jgi:uroporphyrinogen decarboxylase